MICRYCDTVYNAEDRTCAGCGAPKTTLSRAVLDAPATPEHWSNSLRTTTLYTLIATVALAILAGLMALIGWSAVAGLMMFFWAVPAAPTLLTYAAWRSAKGSVLDFLLRLTFAGAVWSGIFTTALIVIGILAS